MAFAKSELCIFDKASPQVVVANAAFEEIYPVDSVSTDDNIDIQFNIMASDNEYVDLNDTLLYVKVIVKKDASTVLAATDTVTPANYFFLTLFQEASLTLNSVKIEGNTSLYSIKALIETALNYSTDTKTTHLKAIGYDATPANRQAWVKESKAFTMCGPLYFDFFDQPKYLLPGVKAMIRLKRSDNVFCLTTAVANLKPILKITEARLYVRRVKVDPSVLMGHRLGLETQNASYPIQRTELVFYTIPKGSTSFYKDALFGDMRLPKFVLVTFQTTTQQTGSYTTNSETFSNSSVNYISLGRNADFVETYKQDFDNNDYVCTYMQSIVRNMGLLNKNINNGISMDLFKSTYPFFTFVLAPDYDVEQAQLPAQGNLRLEVRFAKALEESTVMYIYGVFDAEVEITKNGTVIV